MEAKVTVEIKGEEVQINRDKITRKQFDLLRKVNADKSTAINEIQATGKISKENLDMVPTICVTCEWFEGCNGICGGGCEEYQVAVDKDR